MNPNDLDQDAIHVLLKAAGTYERRLNRLAQRHGDSAAGKAVTRDLVALYEARDLLGEACIGFPPAVTTPAEVLRIREFFMSEAIGTFADIHQVGPNPWAATIDESGNLVLSDADRQNFYAVRPGGAGYEAVHFSDAMALVDPETPVDVAPGEGRGTLLSEDGYETPAEAFEAILDHAGLDLPSPPAR